MMHAYSNCPNNNTPGAKLLQQLDVNPATALCRCMGFANTPEPRSSPDTTPQHCKGPELSPTTTQGLLKRPHINARGPGGGGGGGIHPLASTWGSVTQRATHSSVCLFCFVKLLPQLVPLPLQLGDLNLLHLLLLLSSTHLSLSLLKILPELRHRLQVGCLSCFSIIWWRLLLLLQGNGFSG